MEAVVAQGKLGGSRLGEHFRKRRRMYLIAFVIIVVIAAFVIILLLTHHSATDTVAQKKLENQLSVAENAANAAGVVNAASQLIDGAKNGIFAITNKDLGQIHLYKAQALTSTHQYKTAIPDYQQALQLDPSLGAAALGGEAQAMYAAGERQQVIPILRQLVADEKKITDDPVASQMAAMYENDISAIQTNQEASF